MERTQANSLEFKIGRNVWLGLALTGLFTIGAAMGAAVSAQAQSAQEEVERLNHEAMEAYHVMDVDRAGGMLEEALRVAGEGGVTADALALTHLNLGVVYIGALGDDVAGSEQFVAGLCLNSGLELDPLTSTPQMKSTFTAARKKAGSGNCPTAVATANGSAPSAAETASSGYQGDNSYAAMDPAMDDETPWDGVERNVNKGRMARTFAQFSLALGGLWVGEGMEADRPAPEQSIFRYREGNIDRPATDARIRWEQHIVEKAAAVGAGTPEMPAAATPEPDLFLPGAQDTGRTDWVPDADSEDAFSNRSNAATGQLYGPYGGTCAADGIATGPRYAIANADNLFPSKYCVRIQSPGFVFGPALRFNVGYFVTETFSLALVSRLQFGSGAGFMAGMLIGGRGEWLLLNPGEKGLSVSIFAGLTLGQIQAKVSASEDGPWTLTGPVGAHVGSNIRYRFTRNVGIVVGPQVDLLFPAFTYNIDLPVGVEVAF